MFIISYRARIERAGPDEFIVRFPDLPEALTSGATGEEALSNAADALATAVEGYLDAGTDLPRPLEAGPDEVAVVLDPKLAARMLLRRVMTEQNVSGRALAQRMGRDEKQVRRVLTGRGATLNLTLDALRALGVRPGLAAPGLEREVDGAPALVEA